MRLISYGSLRCLSCTWVRFAKLEKSISAYHEGLDHEREGSGKEHNLPVLGEKVQELLDDGRKFGTEKLVGFIHDKGGALCEICDSLAGQIEHTTGRTDENVDGFVETDNVVFETSSSGSDHDIDAQMLAEGLAYL